MVILLLVVLVLLAAPSPASSVERVVVTQTFPVGSTPVRAVNIQDAVGTNTEVWMEYRVDIKPQTDPAHVMGLDLECRGNNNRTWESWGGFRRPGEVNPKDLAGNPLTRAAIAGYMKPDVTRECRAVFVTNQPITTTIYYEDSLKPKRERQAHQSIAYVDSGIKACSAVTTCTTDAVTTTNGNLIVLNLAYYIFPVDTDIFSTVSDSKSNAWTNAMTQATGNQAIRQYYKDNCTCGTSHTFTMTTTGSSFITIVPVEVSQAVTPTALDKTANSSTLSGAGTSRTTPSTATTAQANELLVGLGSSSIATTYTQTGTGWVQAENQATDATFEGIIVGYRNVTATGTYAYTFTIGSDVDTVQGIGTYKEAAAAAGAGGGLLLRGVGP